MSRCTAPRYGHRTASAAANCPACSSRSSRSYYSSYSSPYSDSSYSFNRLSNSSSNSGGGKSRSKKASWSSISSTILYTSEEIKTLTPVRENVEKRSSLPDLRDIFLCHAWDDRKESAKELHDLLESKGVSVWFSEKDVVLGSPLMREIDRGLAKSKVGIVLVTPSFLNRINNAGIADKELSALLARDLLIPIVHNTTYDNLRDVSPLLGSRSGLNTAEETLAEIAAKLAELVAPEDTLIEA
ncbi:toll/interleukin-1 receptor domain-containing protein [Chryseobacterium sp. GMJ5]|uniref:Toll/interleukin-1 receptor domain-containing protein n=1 Tax=Chryseobacterium gilvum TaxID=2976534 RepID=A0ABT2VZQ4_9FLAO|nr:toll/interleukin-1 receptor domain-containing protein [Chryseobacterium gilvum]MCU7615119.1 toll/interleukin-1 receptor domain-containing protein [Chryseobacterium gilvum]